MNWREVASTAVVCALCALFAAAAFMMSSDLNESVTGHYSVEEER